MSIQTKAIGVFDSGLGGISVLRELMNMMPNENFIYYGDSAYAPYGEKSRCDITSRCCAICDFLIQKGVKAIVIACNTATSACVEELRSRYPKLAIIGMEPAVKLAVKNKTSKQIVVMATSFTLREKKFKELMERCCSTDELIRIPCPALVKLVEHDELDDQKRVEKQLQEYFKDIDMAQVDSIVLGCTHFVFFKSYIARLIPDTIKIVDGNTGTARHVKEIITENHHANPQRTKGSIQIYNSETDTEALKVSEKLLNRRM